MAKKTTSSPNASNSNTAPRRRSTINSGAEAAAGHRSVTKISAEAETAAPAVVPPAGESKPTPITITRDDISLLAFSYFEQRGYQGGSPDEDWLRAEQKLLQLAG